LTINSNIGLFFFIILLSVVLSLQISLIRSLLFIELICKSTKLTTEDFNNLNKENYLVAFRAVVDEHFRYHQFWGGIFIILPFLYLGWGLNKTTHSGFLFWSVLILFILISIITFWGAKQSYLHYVNRSKSILGGKQMPNGWDKTRKSIPNSDRPTKPSKPAPKPSKPAPSKPSKPIKK
jgi:hypothetical protein